jgi:hypothetical protein
VATRDVSGRGVGEEFDAAPGVQPGSADGETRRFLIQTSDGSLYEATATADALALVMAGLGNEPFVRLGDTVVRCDDVRAVFVSEEQTGRRTSAGQTRGSRMSTMQQDRTYGGDTTSRMTPMRGQRGWADGWSETKGSGKTTELLALVLGIIAIATCTAVFDELNAWRGLLLITGLTAAYILSRGSAKAGSSHLERDNRGWHDGR